MHDTDACVFPYPTGDSSLRRMALEARDLGLDSIVAAGAGGGTYAGVEIIGGTVIQAREFREVQAALRTATPGRGLVMASAGEYTFNRAVIQNSGVNVLRGIHAAPKNAFDHILSRMASERVVAVDLDLSLLVSERGYMRQRAIHRYADILRLHDRFGFPLTISSGARSITGMKSRRDMAALGGLFGLDATRLGEALGGVSRLLREERPVEVVE